MSLPRLFKNRIFLIGIGVIVLGLAIWGTLSARQWYHANLAAPQAGQVADVLVRIEPGTSSPQIAAQLAASGLIRSKVAFEWYLFGHGLANRLQAGLYRLHPGQTAPEVASVITTGETAVHTVVVRGSMELAEIKQALVAAGYDTADVKRAFQKTYNYSLLKDKPAGASLEGYIFPDTYKLEIDQGAAAMVDLMLANSDQKITTEIRAGWRAQKLNVHQGLTLASIVQRETSDAEDQKQVAQVFLKRLKIGKKLESDVTFIFAAHLLNVAPSLHVNSPYNTYIHHGLPPTPIGTVELPAALAVAQPATTQWLYFLADKDGNTHFATTVEQHERNKAKYLQ